MRRTIAALFAFLVALPGVAHATAFTTALTVDLTSSFLTTITPITLNVGDSLTVDVTFVDSQALQIGNAGLSEFFFLDFFPSDLGSGDNFSANASLDLSGLSGEFLASLPFNAFSNGQFIGAGVFGDLTNSSFSFTDVHASITLTASTEPFVVDRIRVSPGTPNSVLISAVPQPATLSLLAVGLASFGTIALRRLGRSRHR